MTIKTEYEDDELISLEGREMSIYITRDFFGYFHIQLISKEGKSICLETKTRDIKVKK